MPSFHPEFDKLFEFGIDPPVGRLPEDQPSDWPRVAEVERYNARVREAIDLALEQDQAPEQIWHVAIEHRLMHAETLAYMLHNLDPTAQNRAGRNYDADRRPGDFSRRCWKFPRDRPRWGESAETASAGTTNSTPIPSRRQDSPWAGTK